MVPNACCYFGDAQQPSGWPAARRQGWPLCMELFTLPSTAPPSICGPGKRLWLSAGRCQDSLQKHLIYTRPPQIRSQGPYSGLLTSHLRWDIPHTSKIWEPCSLLGGKSGNVCAPALRSPVPQEWLAHQALSPSFLHTVFSRVSDRISAQRAGQTY